jgi:probable rRNA maturation factor
MARAALDIEVQIEAAAWRKAWPGAVRAVRRLLLRAVERPELAGTTGTVVVVLADDARLKALNARFRGTDRPTNVLSFPDPRVPLGGLALALETVKREAVAQEKDFVSHSKHLILHGFLHLLGYDHQSARQARLMEGLEIAMLLAMGIPNPYLCRTKTRA